jgi:hypothetical protein
LGRGLGELVTTSRTRAMLVEFLKGNHFKVASATVLWLRGTKGPACCQEIGLSQCPSVIAIKMNVPEGPLRPPRLKGGDSGTAPSG